MWKSLLFYLSLVPRQAKGREERKERKRGKAERLMPLSLRAFLSYVTLRLYAEES